MNLAINEPTDAPPPPLSTVLAGQPVGAWVVLNADMTSVLGSAATPAEAMRLANVKVTQAEDALSERPVLMKIPDPSSVCFY